MKKLISILLFLPIMASCATLSKSDLDAEVKRLCAIDGGIEIYETVKLPADKFNEYGQVNFYRPIESENALGEKYIFKTSTQHLQQGNPEMWRTHLQIIRRADGKLLGESISYSRRGGDAPGPWHDSSYGCPEERGDVPLLTKIFQK